MEWFEVVAWVVVAVLAVPLAVLTVECLAALLPRRAAALPSEPRPRCAVLIPAHNEEAVIANTLRAVAAQLAPGDRVLVVADNCTDTTAAIVREHGAEVVERTDAVRRGKGYALAFGREALRAAPPEVVIVLDADCTLGDYALCRLVVEAAARQCPVQACYLMGAPPEAGPNRRVAAFAFLVKNLVRPLGLRNLGFGCLLTGTGMAFPWELFSRAPLGDGHIVEDMGLSIELVAQGQAPVFLPDAEVRAEFPVDESAAGSQRRRWEHGHLRVILAGVPRLLGAALRRLRPGLAVAALDVAVPPLSALVMVTGLVLFGLGIWAALGGPLAPLVALGSVALAASAGLAIVWVRYGRSVLPFGSLLRVPLYALKKIPLYLGFVTKPQRDWVRTARDQQKP
jgi:cellulose synthase/poly-beta-1,6-N-acetylglucosamine synthase-like glycosyltransferase